MLPAVADAWSWNGGVPGMLPRRGVSTTGTGRDAGPDDQARFLPGPQPGDHPGSRRGLGRSLHLLRDGVTDFDAGASGMQKCPSAPAIGARAADTRSIAVRGGVPGLYLVRAARGPQEGDGRCRMRQPRCHARSRRARR